jgi:signal transduction histidine kinase
MMNNSLFKSKEIRWFALLLSCTIFLLCLFFVNNTLIVIVCGVFLFGCIVWISFKEFVKINTLTLETKFKDDEKEAIIEYLHDGIIVYDTNFVIKTFNRAAESLLGISKEVILEKQMEPGLAKTHELKPLIQVLFPSIAPAALQTSEPGAWPQTVTISLDAPKLELETVLNQVITKDGTLVGFLKVIKDRTREKSVLEAKTDFINVAAHQLRTPITALHWALENIVTYSEGNETIYPIAKEALSVANRASKITNDLLDVSKIEEGRFGYSFKDEDLIPFLKKILADMKSLADAYSVSIKFESFSESVPVYIDENRLSAVFFNIIDNAIRYNTKNGRVLISVFPIESKPFIKISVSDTGVGIPAADVQKLFQKLHRGSNVVQMEPNGSGLGLYIAKNIIEQHGGKIEVASEINRGTTFSIVIPLDKSLVPQREVSKIGF